MKKVLIGSAIAVAVLTVGIAGIKLVKYYMETCRDYFCGEEIL